MEGIAALCLIVFALVIIFCKGLYDQYKFKKDTLRKLKNCFGRYPENTYQAERYKHLSYYFDNQEHKGDIIDDTTWNDLDMDRVFMYLNQTCTGLGEEHLYAMLRSPLYNQEALKERDRIISYFEDPAHEQERVDIQFQLCQFGKMRRGSVYEYLSFLIEAPDHKPYFHIFLLAGLLVSILAAIVINPAAIGFIIMFVCLNMVLYGQRHHEIEVYFNVFAYLIQMIEGIHRLSGLKVPELNELLTRMEQKVAPLRSLRKLSSLFSAGNDLGQGPLALFLDYTKMLTHIDLIMFDVMRDKVQANRQNLYEAMEMVGTLDAEIGIASYRHYVDNYCKPEFVNGSRLYEAEELYHPMIEKPVANSFSTRNSVLLTGSNASGKSTFLKTVAINTVLAQTVYTCLAKTYRASFYRVYSSMALQDNLVNNESYYIVEIKSLKRIIDKANEEVPMLCFVDEVLRGTNTVERISASSRILYDLSKKNCLCFAATHDIELTAILEKVYNNYHFQEEIEDNQVRFDYKLYQGQATSRNAIKLLGIIGFEQPIIEAAETVAKSFESTGVWPRFSE